MSTSYFILYGKISCARKLVVAKMFTAEAPDTSWTLVFSLRIWELSAISFTYTHPLDKDIFLLSSKTYTLHHFSETWKALSRCRPGLYLLTSLPGILDPMLWPLHQWTFVLTLQMSPTRTRIIILQSGYQIISNLTWSVLPPRYWSHLIYPNS